MTDALNDEEIDELLKLGPDIQLSLECCMQMDGLPCRTDRLHAVKLMKKYLEIHDYTVKDNQEDDNGEIN